MKENNIYKVLLENKRVNNYTKLLILLNTLDFYKDYYIPNGKITKMLKIDKRSIKKLLKQMKEDNIIYITYRNNKRYFGFKFFESNEEKQFKSIINYFDYNWLEEE